MSAPTRSPLDPPAGRQPLSGARSEEFEYVTSDPVESWKRCVQAALSDQATGREMPPSASVRVTPGFVVLAVVVGALHGLRASVSTLVIVSSVLLVHELGRAAVARARGRSSRRVISASGSATEVVGRPLRGVDAALLPIAGPIANAAAGAAALSITSLGIGAEAAALLRGLAVAHAAWGAAQLLPLTPFRAGASMASRLSPSGRLAHAAVSVTVLAVALVLVEGALKAPVLLALVAVSLLASVSSLSEAHGDDSDARSGVDLIALEAEALLSKGDVVQAAMLAERGLAAARSPSGRQRLWKVFAWAQIGRQDPFRAHDALLQLRAGAVDLHLLAAYLGCCNRVDEAVALLEEARSLGHRAPETTKLLADLLLRRGEHRAIRALAESDDEPLSLEDRRAIEAALSSDERV